jgi:hypothetical protein
MALADYYARGALAAAQVLKGFDEERFRTRLDETPVGIRLASRATKEADALADLLVRLLSRLYPRLAILGPPGRAADLAELATSVNPAIELVEVAPVGVVIGRARASFATNIFAGSSGWDALIGTTGSQPVGNSANPFGAGVAACLAAANLFRHVFLSDWEQRADRSLRFSAWSLDRADKPTERAVTATLRAPAVLVGFGAIGNAALWALSRAPLTGALHVVDPQRIELGNLQRYALTIRADEDRVKVDLATGQSNGLKILPYHGSLAEYLGSEGYRWDSMLLGLDSARDRCAAQASLPRWLANAWTQPGDLGVSVHPHFAATGACVACLYRPDDRLPNEDELVSEALGVPGLKLDVRALLYSGTPVGRAFLEAVAQGATLPIEALLPFQGRSVRELYVEGFCGGAVIPLSMVGLPPEDLHVPLAHQSALAGVLLAATLVRHALGVDPPITTAARLDVLAPVGTALAQPLRSRPDGRCLCDDAVFRAVYQRKYAERV